MWPDSHVKSLILPIWTGFLVYHDLFLLLPSFVLVARVALPSKSAVRGIPHFLCTVPSIIKDVSAIFVATVQRRLRVPPAMPCFVVPGRQRSIDSADIQSALKSTGDASDKFDFSLTWHENEDVTCGSLLANLHSRTDGRDPEIDNRFRGMVHGDSFWTSRSSVYYVNNVLLDVTCVPENA